VLKNAFAYRAAELEWVKVLGVNSKLGMVIMLKFCLHW
jgi:hypothetical protein